MLTGRGVRGRMGRTKAINKGSEGFLKQSRLRLDGGMEMGIHIPIVGRYLGRGRRAKIAL